MKLKKLNLIPPKPWIQSIHQVLSKRQNPMKSPLLNPPASITVAASQTSGSSGPQSFFIYLMPGDDGVWRIDGM